MNQMSVAIEGLIGVGKSTVLRELQTRGHTVEYEKVDHWSLLPHMYAARHETNEGASGIRTLFEIQILCSLAARGESNFTERSIASAQELFMPLLVTSEEHRELIQKVADLARVHAPDPKLWIYLDADVDVCMERIHARNRDGEDVSREYLELLKSAHDTWIMTKPHVRVRVHKHDSAQDVADKIQGIIASL